MVALHYTGCYLKVFSLPAKGNFLNFNVLSRFVIHSVMCSFLDLETFLNLLLPLFSNLRSKQPCGVFRLACWCITDKIDLQACFGTNFKGCVAPKLEERLNHNETITTNKFSRVWPSFKCRCP